MTSPRFRRSSPALRQKRPFNQTSILRTDEPRQDWLHQPLLCAHVAFSSGGHSNGIRIRPLDAYRDLWGRLDAGMDSEKRLIQVGRCDLGPGSVKQPLAA
jgi:hypothetical protein